MNKSLKNIKHYPKNVNIMYYEAPTNFLYNFNFIIE